MNSNSTYRPVYISLKLSSEANEALSESAKRTGRTKKTEARLRLESHLRHFESILDLDNFLKRETI
ncbi:TPA: TraY domain-containing protein [Legionella pneumophila]|nr:TraY domain-containing protein [Legionella pneumophila]